MKHPLRTLGILAVFGFICLLFCLSDVPTVYMDTSTEQAVGCSRDGIEMSIEEPLCKAISQGRHEKVWVQSGWGVSK